MSLTYFSILPFETKTGRGRIKFARSTAGGGRTRRGAENIEIKYQKFRSRFFMRIEFGKLKKTHIDDDDV